MSVALHQARSLAQDFISLINPFVVKSLIVGSVRRQVQNPNDIDIIAQPIIKIFPQKNLFGEDTTTLVNNHLLTSGVLDDIPDWIPRMRGPIQFRYEATFYNNLYLDLWLVPPEQWGIASIIRTGNEGFNIRLMHHTLQNRKHVTNQRLHDHPREGTTPETRKPCKLEDKCTRIIPTPTEEEFLSAIGLPIFEPTIRTVQTINEVIGEY